MKKLLLCTSLCIALISCKDEKADKTTYVISKDSAATANNDTSSMSANSTDTSSAMAAAMDSVSMMKAWQAYMTPGEPHKILVKSNGTWDEEVKMFMTPGAPPQIMKATFTCSMTLMACIAYRLLKALATACLSKAEPQWGIII